MQSLEFAVGIVAPTYSLITYIISDVYQLRPVCGFGRRIGTASNLYYSYLSKVLEIMSSEFTGPFLKNHIGFGQPQLQSIEIA